MTQILKTLLIAAILSGSSAFAQDMLKVSQENGSQRIDFTLNGKTACVLIDDRITCATTIKPMQVAASETK